MLASTTFPGLLGKALYQNPMPHELDVGILMKACQKQAVLGSCEIAKSLWRRISPANGERTSPGWEPLPGNAFPLRRTSRKTWESLFYKLALSLSSPELNRDIQGANGAVEGSSWNGRVNLILRWSVSRVSVLQAMSNSRQQRWCGMQGERQPQEARIQRQRTSPRLW
jgi:hypothetical protein